MKLITLNLEGDRHLDVALPFFARENPDILCLQEVYETDMVRIARDNAMHYAFEAMTLRPRGGIEETSQPFGIGLVSKKEIKRVSAHLYHETVPPLSRFDDSTPERTNATIRRMVLIGEIEGMKIGTTHFNWSPNGVEDEAQLEAFPKLIEALNTYSELLLCGDFNIPRGVNSLYGRLISHFTDCIPLEIIGSVDVSRHRRRDTPLIAERISKYMVDYILTRGNYSVSDVRQVCGVSDHCAFVAEISTSKP